MESRAGTKRPWENEECIEVHSKRRGSTLTASLVRQLSPLPPQTGFYAHDRPTLNHTILPPLLTSPYSGPDNPITSSSSQCWPPPQALELLDGSKRRSHSLVQAFDHRHRPGDQRIHKEPPTIYSRIPGLSATSPPSGATVNPGPDPPPASAVGSVTCCPPHCRGQVCSNSRSLIRKLVTDLSLLVDRLKDLTRTEQQASYKPPEPSHTKFEESLQWALDLVHESNLRLQEHVEQRSSRSPRSQTPPDDSPNMRRSQHYLEEREEQSPPTRHHTLHHDYGQLLRSNASPEDPRRNPYGMVATIIGNSPRQTATVPGNVYMPPQSPPIQAPQSMHSNLLPSPSSLNFSSSQSLPSMTPPISTHASAHSTLLQDLQHQVTVKTLEFRTLQREYDALLQKLERQKTKCTTLEKKFEVSDVEINSLTDEKEKLQAQVTTMEGQVEELQQSRDEARRQLIANGAQYMRIMEMANRLQTQSADDKKKWEAEKSELEQRIRVLEEAMVTGGEHRTAASGTGTGTGNQTTSTAVAPPTNFNTTTPAPPPLSSTSQTETINVLRAEVSRLRSRTQTLESAVKTMRRESISIQTAARQLVDSSGKLEDVAQGIVEEGG